MNSDLALQLAALLDRVAAAEATVDGAVSDLVAWYGEHGAEMIDVLVPEFAAIQRRYRRKFSKGSTP